MDLEKVDDSRNKYQSLLPGFTEEESRYHEQDPDHDLKDDERRLGNRHTAEWLEDECADRVGIIETGQILLDAVDNKHGDGKPKNSTKYA